MFGRRYNNAVNNLASLDGSGNNSVNFDNGLVEKYDKKMLNWLVQLHQAISKESINLDEVGSLMEMVKHISNEYNDRYLMSLLYPESNYGKIPTPFPVPTSEVRDHLTYTITTSAADAATNSSGGNFCFVYNPYYCSDKSATTRSSFYLNTNTTMGGAATDDNFIARDVGQSTLPSGMYSTYRLVSASVTVNYIGRMDIVSGTLGCGIGFNGVAPAGLTGTDKATNAAVYGNFNLIDDAYFSQRTQCINGLRMIYFPLDNNYTNFIPLTNAINGFYFVVYGQGLPASSASVRVDIYLNYEFTVNPAYSSYVAQSPGCCGDTGSALNYATGLIQRNPNLVTQANGEVGRSTISSAGWFTKFLGGAAKALETADSVSKFIPGAVGGQNNQVQGNPNDTSVARYEG
jgi:hypothetical protein